MFGGWAFALTLPFFYTGKLMVQQDCHKTANRLQKWIFFSFSTESVDNLLIGRQKQMFPPYQFNSESSLPNK